MERVGKLGSNTVASRHRNTLSCSSAASLISLLTLPVDNARRQCDGDRVENKKDGRKDDNGDDDDDGPTWKRRRGLTLAPLHHEERQRCRIR